MASALIGGTFHNSGIASVEGRAADPRNPASVCAAGSGGLAHTIDADATWSKLAAFDSTATSFSKWQKTRNHLLYVAKFQLDCRGAGNRRR